MRKKTCDICGEEAYSFKYIYKVGWACEECLGYKIKLPEREPQSIKDDREKNFTDILQPYRNGELSREFVEAYPEKAESYATKEEIAGSKYVWRDLPGHAARKIKKPLEQIKVEQLKKPKKPKSV